MPDFGTRSHDNLKTCDERLRALFLAVVNGFDCSVIEGHRSMERQNELFHAGQSKLQAGESKHNSRPSLAVDVVPYPIDWDDWKRFYWFGGYVMGVASRLSLPIRWGGDWDGDTHWRDQQFHDLPHFELMET